MTLHERVRDIFNRYHARYPNERQNIAEEGASGNHYRVMLGWICMTYAFEANVHENQMRFERPAVKAAVEELVRVIGE